VAVPLGLKPAHHRKKGKTQADAQQTLIVVKHVQNKKERAGI
jgi:hypothetical protein